MSDAGLEDLLRRDRAILLAALVALAALAWISIVWAGTAMDGHGLAPPSPHPSPGGGMDMMMAPGGQPAAHRIGANFADWAAADFVIMSLMWAVMMVGMMTPSAAPMILIYARVGRQAASRGKVFAPAGWFASGYLLAWTGYAMIATILQWLLERTTLLTPMMAGASPLFGGLLLIAAGAYQWTPLKDACLGQCQSPLLFIQRHGGFRGGRGAALALGLRHGSYCIGCCWALMLLLFVGGVMNLVWIAAIAGLVLAEKVIPFGRLISRIAGLTLIAGGIALIASAS